MYLSHCSVPQGFLTRVPSHPVHVFVSLQHSTRVSPMSALTPCTCICLVAAFHKGFSHKRPHTLYMYLSCCSIPEGFLPQAPSHPVHVFVSLQRSTRVSHTNERWLTPCTCICLIAAFHKGFSHKRHTPCTCICRVAAFQKGFLPRVPTHPVHVFVSLQHSTRVSHTSALTPCTCICLIAAFHKGSHMSAHTPCTCICLVAAFHKGFSHKRPHTLYMYLSLCSIPQGFSHERSHTLYMYLSHCSIPQGFLPWVPTHPVHVFVSLQHSTRVSHTRALTPCTCICLIAAFHKGSHMSTHTPCTCICLIAAFQKGFSHGCPHTLYMYLSHCSVPQGFLTRALTHPVHVFVSLQHSTRVSHMSAHTPCTCICRVAAFHKGFSHERPHTLYMYLSHCSVPQGFLPRAPSHPVHVFVSLQHSTRVSPTSALTPCTCICLIAAFHKGFSHERPHTLYMYLSHCSIPQGFLPRAPTHPVHVFVSLQHSTRVSHTSAHTPCTCICLIAAFHKGFSHEHHTPCTCICRVAAFHKGFSHECPHTLYMYLSHCSVPQGFLPRAPSHPVHVFVLLQHSTRVSPTGAHTPCTCICLIAVFHKGFSHEHPHTLYMYLSCCSVPQGFLPRAPSHPVHVFVSLQRSTRVSHMSAHTPCTCICLIAAFHKGFSHERPHTLYMSHQTDWSVSQRQAQALMFTFAHCLAYANSVYGVSVSNFVSLRNRWP